MAFVRRARFDVVFFQTLRYRGHGVVRRVADKVVVGAVDVGVGIGVGGEVVGADDVFVGVYGVDVGVERRIVDGNDIGVVGEVRVPQVTVA